MASEGKQQPEAIVIDIPSSSAQAVPYTLSGGQEGSFGMGNMMQMMMPMLMMIMMVSIMGSLLGSMSNVVANGSLGNITIMPDPATAGEAISIDVIVNNKSTIKSGTNKGKDAEYTFIVGYKVSIGTSGTTDSVISSTVSAKIAAGESSDVVIPVYRLPGGLTGEDILAGPSKVELTLYAADGTTVLWPTQTANFTVEPTAGAISVDVSSVTTANGTLKAGENITVDVVLTNKCKQNNAFVQYGVKVETTMYVGVTNTQMVGTNDEVITANYHETKTTDVITLPANGVKTQNFSFSIPEQYDGWTIFKTKVIQPVLLYEIFIEQDVQAWTNEAHPQKHTITANVSPAGAGTVALTPSTQPYDSGSTVTATASAVSGYSFDHWEISGYSSTFTQNPIYFEMNGDYVITAVFTQTNTQYTLTVSASPAGAGTVTGGGTWAQGTIVTINATPSSGYQFSYWTVDGVQSSLPNPTQITMNSAHTVVAVLAATQQYSVTLSVSPAGAGTATQAKDSSNRTIITATPISGYTFDHWLLDGVTITTNPYSIGVLISNHTAIAYFYQGTPPEPALVYLTTGVSPAGAGTVSGGGYYEVTITATITATPSSGYQFSHWMVDGVDYPAFTDATTTIYMGSAHSVTAIFVQVTTVTLRTQLDSIWNYILWNGADPSNSGVHVYRNGGNKYYGPYGSTWLDEIGYIKYGEAPWIYVTQNCTLTYKTQTSYLYTGVNNISWLVSE